MKVKFFEDTAYGREFVSILMTYGMDRLEASEQMAAFTQLVPASQLIKSGTAGAQRDAREFIRQFPPEEQEA